MRATCVAIVFAIGCSTSPATTDAGPDDGGVLEQDAAPAIDATLVDDGGVDAGLASDGGPGYGGECTVVPQSGCEIGEACRFARAADSSLVSVCQSAGPLEEGERCAAGDDQCAPGLVCSADFCRRFCLVDGAAEQCPPLDGMTMECLERDPGFPVGRCEPSR
jgi:hypothetical protein